MAAACVDMCQPIGDKCRGPEPGSGNSLDDHHAGGQGDDEPGSALVALVMFSEEHMVARAREARGIVISSRS